jgi:hypothetical protein
MPGLALTVATRWIVVALPTAIPTTVSIAVRLRRLDSQKSGVLGPANSTKKPHESAIHSMKEKQQ